MSIFTKVAIEQPKKSVFKLSHSNKLTAQAGYIVPVLCQYTMPGDKWNIDLACFCRTLALKAPMMQRVNIDFHFFAVPLRIIWDDFERFISGPEKPTSYTNGVAQWDADPIHPYTTLQDVDSNKSWYMQQFWTTSSLADYIGFPVIPRSTDFSKYSSNGTMQKIDLLPFRAYQQIYNDWYRDENLIDEINIDKSSGPKTFNGSAASLFTLRSRAWKKDYFTSALPWPQRGDDVLLPLVNSDGSKASAPVSGSSTLYNGESEGPLVVQDKYISEESSGNPLSFFMDGSLQADLSKVRSSTIIEIRRAFALQKWFENSARLGGRYIEQMLAHFGVQSSDARLQRAEFLGGTSVPVVVDSVQQTSESGETPQGYLTGNGTAVGGAHVCTHFSEEHCLILGLMTIKPESQYVLGIPRQFQMFERFDFPFPEFANIGEQAIKNKELFWTDISGNSIAHEDDTFGYAPRYSEFKFIPSTIHGEFQDTLNYWTMAHKFDSTVALNQSFIDITESSESNKRPFTYQSTDQDDYLVQINFDITAVRPLPYYSTPGYID